MRFRGLQVIQPSLFAILPEVGDRVTIRRVDTLS